MPTMILPENLPIEKTFRRLLSTTEKLLEENSIDDWRLDQFVTSLDTMLNDMYKSIKPKPKQYDEYKQRINKLRQNIDPIRLADQTFPRQASRPNPTDVPIKEQQTETITSPISSTQVETNHSTSNKSDRPNLNRQQQYIQSEEEKQDDIATSMRTTTRSILNSAKRLNEIVKDDQKKLIDAENLIDTNTGKLNIQHKRLRQNAYSGSNCWIYLMLIIVIVTFIYLTLFMRMFRKRITTIVQSKTVSKSSLFDNSVNQSTINNTNITTTTKSTDYISLLLNYANDNHTDL